FSTFFSGAISPGGLVNVGVDLIPASTLRSLGDMSGANILGGEKFSSEVVATLSIKGEVNGDAITATPYVFPVTVCSNCVFNNAGTCPMKVAPRTGDPCNPYQDGVV